MNGGTILLLDEVAELSPRVLEAYPGALACDCYVAGVERLGSPVAWGWSLAGGENIDHHAPVREMAREISSANLALRWVAEGPGPATGPILLTHTDCDSILTAGIVSGRLEPLERYGDAAIAADHTGAEDPIADLLQAIQQTRDVEYSLAALARLEAGLPLDAGARAALEVRQRKREAATEAVASGRFDWAGDIAWAQFDREIDGEFFPALLPEAKLIVVGTPMPNASDKLAIKVRRGHAMPDGVTLDDLKLKQIDPAYGGRWNAGSTKRGGGTEVTIEGWLDRLQKIAGEG